MEEIFDAKVVYKDEQIEENSGGLIEMAEWVCEKIRGQDYRYASILKRMEDDDEIL